MNNVDVFMGFKAAEERRLFDQQTFLAQFAHSQLHAADSSRLWQASTIHVVVSPDYKSC